MRQIFHAIIVDKGLKNKKIFENFRILGNKKSDTDRWTLYKIEIKKDGLESSISTLQKAMVDGPYYFHLYAKELLIIVFKNKLFKVSPKKNSWQKAIAYGESLGIPKKQLDFSPANFEKETY